LNILGAWASIINREGKPKERETPMAKKKVELERGPVVAMFEEMGYPSAGGWDMPKLQNRVNNLLETVKADLVHRLSYRCNS